MWDWSRFLKQLSLRRSADERSRNAVLPEMIEAQWLGHPGASEEQIQAAESRLGVRLPHSYREFLKVSNGWGDLSSDYPGFHLIPVENIDWLVSSEPGVATSWDPEDEASDEEYFVYGSQQDCVHLRWSYLRTCLKISNHYWDTAIALLNPEISLVEGEWEAWRLDGKLAGANRYKTFWDFMKYELLEDFDSES